LWDFRSNDKIVYNDVRDAYEEAQGYSNSQPIILARPEHFDEVRYSVAREAGRIVKMKPKLLPKHAFDLSAFEDGEGDLLIELSEEMLDAVAPRFGERDYQASYNSLGLSDSEDEIS